MAEDEVCACGRPLHYGLKAPELPTLGFPEVTGL